MFKTYQTFLLVAAPLVLLLYFVALPGKTEFLRFGEVLNVYLLPVLFVTGAVALAVMIYTRYTRLGAAQVERLANFWFSATSVLFAAVLVIAFLYVKRSPVPAS